MIRYISALIMTLFLVPSASFAATFNAEFWDASVPITNLTTADAIMANGPATATFLSTAIDYPNGSAINISSNTRLADYLGVDAASIIGPATRTITRSVFRFTGFLDLLAGPQSFSVGSDDGFRLSIGGNVIAQQYNQRSFNLTNITTDAGTGKTAFELVYFENAGVTGVVFSIDGGLAVPSPVPLPSALLLMLAGIAGLGVASRGRIPDTFLQG